MKQKILIGILLLLSITDSFAAGTRRSSANISKVAPIPGKDSISQKDAAAGKDSVDKYIVQTFRAAFSEARDVSWERVNKITKASFHLNGQHLFAYYSEDARLLALGRDISLGQLPLPVTISLSQQLRRKKYAQYYVSCVFEIVSDDTPGYFIVLNKDEEFVSKTGERDHRFGTESQ